MMTAEERKAVKVAELLTMLDANNQSMLDHIAEIAGRISLHDLSVLISAISLYGDWRESRARRLNPETTHKA